MRMGGADVEELDFLEAGMLRGRVSEIREGKRWSRYERKTVVVDWASWKAVSPNGWHGLRPKQGMVTRFGNRY